MKSEKSVERLEKKIARRFTAATKRAQKAALKLGPVLVARNGKLVELLQDGSQRVVREIEPSRPSRKGQKIIIPP